MAVWDHEILGHAITSYTTDVIGGSNFDYQIYDLRVDEQRMNNCVNLLAGEFNTQETLQQGC